MELSFEKEQISYLDCVVSETQNLELQQEVRLPDGMPDIGRIIGAWGQPIIRSKDWRSDSILASGGMMVWILYGCEDDGLQTVDVWIPMQCSWDLPPDCREGTACVTALTRFVDCRSVSPRKMTLRAGAALRAEGYTFSQTEVSRVEAGDDQVQLLRNTYPLRLRKEAGEKTLTLEELLPLPTSGDARIVYCSLRPEVGDCRVLGEKLAFRGCGNLHVLLLEDGELRSENFPLNFSSFSELDELYGSEAGCTATAMVSSLEPELTREGLNIRAVLELQYVVDDVQSLTVTEDAYAPGFHAEESIQKLNLPVILDRRRENCEIQQSMAVDAGRIADVQLMPDYPFRKAADDSGRYHYSCAVQTVYCDRDGRVQGSFVKWQQQLNVSVAQNAELSVWPQWSEDVQALLTGSEVSVQGKLPLETLTCATTDIPMVTGLTLGEGECRQNQPALIVRRAGRQSLWELAKGCGSTVDAICSVNHLEGEPNPGQMLIIPVHA